ncbi:MAG: helix-turn-helix transcriptional regulator [Acidobacteriia bacterium]|nr:helix-turn-helix transcriptional regulator [Terriglobia bacterium]
MAPSDGGFRLKKIREKLGLTQEVIQEASLEIAHREDNPQFAIRHSHLSIIENSRSVPNIYKLYSLCAIYRLDIDEILGWYGISTEKLKALQAVVKVDKTHLVNLRVEMIQQGKTLAVPARLDPSFDPRHTNFLTRLVQAWKEVPIGLLAQLDLKHHVYGFIGLDDYMMFPLLKPGAFVQVDVKRNKIAPEGWASEFDRPIYFLELRDRYACCWCSLEESRLHLIPHPASPCKAKVMSYPAEVTVVGQVVGVTMRLVASTP